LRRITTTKSQPFEKRKKKLNDKGNNLIASSFAYVPPAIEEGRIGILVCADFDWKSATSLSEYYIQQRLFDTNAIDLIVAVGPGASETDLERFLPGGERNHSMFKHIRRQRRRRGLDNDDRDSCVDECSAPFFRPQDVTASLEGI
jgi:hypothetical protein